MTPCKVSDSVEDKAHIVAVLMNLSTFRAFLIFS